MTRVAVPAVAAGVLFGALTVCAGASSHNSTRSAPTPQGSTRTSTVLRLPLVGSVVVVREPRAGMIIFDRATRGKRFYLYGIQARECLSFLKANPHPSRADFSAACPGARR
jgi:type IV secretory pathway protease TraF